VSLESWQTNTRIFRYFYDQISLSDNKHRTLCSTQRPADKNGQFISEVVRMAFPELQIADSQILTVDTKH
jgi:hypothetical protein